MASYVPYPIRASADCSTNFRSTPKSIPQRTNWGSHQSSVPICTWTAPSAPSSAFEGLIGGTGVIDEVFDRQIMHGRNAERTWLYCLTTSGAYEQIHKGNDDIVAEQMALLVVTIRRPSTPKSSRRRWSRCPRPLSRESSARTHSVRRNARRCRRWCWRATRPLRIGRPPWRALRKVPPSQWICFSLVATVRGLPLTIGVSRTDTHARARLQRVEDALQELARPLFLRVADHLGR